MSSLMPVDILDRLAARRQSIVERMVRDLALSDTKQIDEYIDQRLRTFLQRMDEYRPPLVYLVTTSPRLTEIMKQGWTDPRFYYNRAAGDVQYSTRVSLALDEHSDMVVPLLYNPDDSPEARQRRIIEKLGESIPLVEPIPDGSGDRALGSVQRLLLLEPPSELIHERFARALSKLSMFVRAEHACHGGLAFDLVDVDEGVEHVSRRLGRGAECLEEITAKVGQAPGTVTASGQTMSTALFTNVSFGVGAFDCKDVRRQS